MNCAPPGRRPDHADGLVAGLQHGLDRIDDRRPCRHGAHVDIMIDRRRQVGAGEQPSLLTHLDGDGARADAVEDLPRQRVRNHAGGCGVQHQGRGVGRRQPVVEPVHPEIGDRRNVNQDLSQDDQRNGQQQQLAGQAEPALRLRPRRLFGCSAVLPSLTRYLPSVAGIFRMRPARESVKLQFDNVGAITQLRWAAGQAASNGENPATNDIYGAKYAVSKKPGCGKVPGRRQRWTAGSRGCRKPMISGRFCPANRRGKGAEWRPVSLPWQD